MNATEISPGVRHEVRVLPTGLTTVIAGIDRYGGPIDEAFPPMSVNIRLADDLDISRGDMLCRPNNAPTATQDVEAMLCWFNEHPMREGAIYGIKHTTRVARAKVQQLHYGLDVNSLHREEGHEALAMNDIGRVTLRSTAPLFVDEYRRNRTTGSFVLVDESTYETVAAGMILGPTS